MTIFPSFFVNKTGGYEIEQSLRFDGSTGKLTRTNPASSGITNAYKWSYSFWVKQSDVTSTGTIEQPLLSGGNTSGSGYTYCGWGYVDSGRFWIGNYTGSDYRPDVRASDRRWRDPSAWEHFMMVYNTSESTNTDRIKIYSNGVRWNPTGGVGSTISSTQLFYAVNYASKASNIGYDNILNKYFDGYMAEVHFVDGQALDQYDFGEFDNNGVWRPIEYTGTYGSNGHYLKFDPTATNGVGHDHSGNGNNWTASGFTTSGTGTDVMSDTPTTNWATLNPIGSTATGGFSEGNLKYLNGTTAVWRSALSTFAVSSGKWYAEVSFTGLGASGTGFVVGISPTSSNVVGVTNHLGQSQIADSIGYYHQGTLYINGSGSSYGASYTNNDVLGIALDLDGGTLHFYKNGVDQGEAASSLTGSWYMGISSKDTTATFNFGQRAFAYTPPTGFSALNTSNLPAPDIADGSDYFNTVLWTGTSAEHAITGVGFQPDWSWIKGRTNSTNHVLSDVVRGSTEVLESDSTAAAYTDAQSVKSFDTDGVTLGTSNDVNNSAASYNSYVGWFWKAGGSGSSNTNGSITSTVSANTTAGFSIVSYTGTGSNATVGHGLGVAPDAIFVKNRDDAGDWKTFHSPLGATKGLQLQSTSSVQIASELWNDTSPTSTVFSVGTHNGTNGSSDDMIAYCFAEVEGYSKFGSYSGNGNANGPFVWCGFKPSWLMIKRTDASADWFIFDTARDTYNVSHKWSKANTTGTEPTGTGDSWDILSNGFKPRNSNSNQNGSGSNYLFLAFASNPFGGSGVSPATAR